MTKTILEEKKLDDVKCNNKNEATISTATKESPTTRISVENIRRCTRSKPDEAPRLSA